jgi:NADPH-dependent curcumin reductase CurA
MVGPHNFEYAETPIPEPKNDEVLVKNLFLSFDPAQRNWMVDRKAYLPPVAIGAPMRAGSVGQVVDSRHADYQVGDLVQTTGYWQDYVVAAPGEGPHGPCEIATWCIAGNDAVSPRYYWAHGVLWSIGSGSA